MTEKVPEFISKPPEDQEWAERMGREEAFKAGYAITEVYRSLPNPEAIRDVTRELMHHHEDISLTLENLSTKYDLTPILAPIRNRRFALSYTNERLRELGIVVEKKDGTLEAKAAGFALRVDTKEKERKITKKIETQQVDEKGNRLTDKEGNLLPPRIEIRTETIETTEEKPDFGTNEERKDVVGALQEAEAEIVVRQLIYEHFKHLASNTDNLEGLVQFYLMPQPTAEALNLFFNLKDVQRAKTETAGGGEVKTFGDKVDMAMRLYYIVALSEKREQLEKLRKTPGWRMIFPNSTPDQPSDEELLWVGSVVNWKDGLRRIGDKAENPKEGNDLVEELDKGHRKGFVAKGNIFAHAGYQLYEQKRLDEKGKPEYVKVPETGAEQETYVRKKVIEFLGGDRSAEAAEEVAFRLFKLWGVAAEMGFEVYENPKYPKGASSSYKLEYEMGPATDDFAKITRPWMYQWKQIFEKEGASEELDTSTIRRDAGPLGTWGRYDRFYVSIFRRLGYDIKIPEYPEEIEIEKKGKGERWGGEVQKRSLVELWWGYSEEKKNIKRFEEDKGGKDVILPSEKAHRLGEIDWDKFGRGIINYSYLGAFMAGRERVGVYQLTRKTDWNPTSLLELTDPDWWGNFNKYMQVAIHSDLPSEGINRRTPDEKVPSALEVQEEIIRSLWDGIRSLPQYDIWKSQGVPVAVTGTPWKVPVHVIPIIVETVEEVTGGRVKLPTEPLEIDRRKAEQNLNEKMKDMVKRIQNAEVF